MSSNVMDFKLRALMNARRKRRKAEQKAKKFALHLLKAGVEIRRGDVFDENPIKLDGFMILNDFSPRSISVFSPVPLDHHEVVIVTIQLSKSIFVKGRVIVCNELPLTEKVFLQHTFRYRVQLQLLFNSIQERSAIERLSESIQVRVRTERAL